MPKKLNLAIVTSDVTFFFHICVNVIQPLPRGDNPIAVNNNNYYYFLWNRLLRYRQIPVRFYGIRKSGYDSYTRSGDDTNLQKCGANPGHWSPHLRHFLSGSSTGVIPLARTTALDMVHTCSNTALIKYILFIGK
jgi:hypothetical protein